MKRSLAVILLITMLFYGTIPVCGEGRETLDEIAGRIEVLLFGTTNQGESINDRLTNIESIIFATNVSGSITDRFDRVRKFLVTNDEYGPSVTYKVNALEWQVFRSIKKGPLIIRVEEIERELYGKELKGGLLKRVESLVVDVMPDSRATGVKAIIPAGTLIKVRLLTQLDSSTTKVGQEVNYEVVEPIVIDDKLVITLGSPGKGIVEEVTQPGKFGANAKFSLGSQVLNSVDGSSILINISERSASFNSNQAVALGVTAIGLTVLGPVGIVSGALVKGRDLVLPVGTEFFVEVASDQEVVGIVVNP